MEETQYQHSGWLMKRGTRFKVWRNRWFSLQGPTLRYATGPPPKGNVKKEFDITGATVRRLDKGTLGHHYGGCITFSPPHARDLYIYADTQEHLDNWITIIEKYNNDYKERQTGGNRLTPLIISSSTSSLTNNSTVTSTTPTPDSSTPLSPITAIPSSPLPNIVFPPYLEINGLNDVGSELHVRAPDDSIDSLCIAWFTVPYSNSDTTKDNYSDSLAGSNDSILSIPGIKFLPGATLYTYTITENEIGKRIGVLCRPAVGPGLRWVMQSKPIVPIDPALPSIRIQIIPHEHSKYCDRRVRVCTAIGRYREGQVLKAIIRWGNNDNNNNTNDLFNNYRIVWYRSNTLNTSQLGNIKNIKTLSSPSSITASSSSPSSGVLNLPPITIPGSTSSVSSSNPTSNVVPPTTTTGLTPRPPLVPRPPATTRNGTSTPTVTTTTTPIPVVSTTDSIPTDTPISLLPPPPLPPPPPSGSVTTVNISSSPLSSSSLPSSSSPPLFTSTGIPFSSSRIYDTATITFDKVDVRPVSDLAPAPPDHAPAPSINEIRARLAPRLIPAEVPTNGFNVYPLFREDIGCMILCCLVPRNQEIPLTLPANFSTSSSSILFSPPVGPIEAAPPKAREIWIEGTPQVGSLLVGNVYYFGGYEGASIVSWTIINDDGTLSEAKSPAPSLLSDQPLPEIQNTLSNTQVDQHPRVLRVTKEHKGCAFKFRVQPIRTDGNEGHLESSRPTKEVPMD